MTVALSIAGIASLVGDPGRANMLVALLDGRALTASELAYAAGVAPATASGHLSKLVKGRLLVAVRQGRYHYFRLASLDIARMLESVMVIAAESEPRRRRATPKISPILREARTCYDHLAGRLAVAVADALVRRGHVVLADDGGEVTAAGMAHLAGIGVELGTAGRHRRRAFCRPCLDWSERRPHLAGRLGAALCARVFELGWVERIKDSRAVAITPVGREGFAEAFGVAQDL